MRKELGTFLAVLFQSEQSELECCEIATLVLHDLIPSLQLLVGGGYDEAWLFSQVIRHHQPGTIQGATFQISFSTHFGVSHVERARC